MGRRRRYYRQQRGNSLGVGWIIFFIIISLLVLSAVIDPKTQGNILVHIAEIIFGLFFECDVVGEDSVDLVLAVLNVEM